MRFILRIFGWLFAAGAIAFVIGAAIAGGLIWHYSVSYTHLDVYKRQRQGGSRSREEVVTGC